MADSTSFYITGGTLPANADSYVVRQADADLFDGLQQREFCYVLNTRQMGKSSLMIRAAQRLRAEGRRVILLDLTAVGKNLTVEQWYGGLVVRLARQTDQTDAVLDFWKSGSNLGPMQRLIETLRQTLLAPASGANENVVIFIDEIDMVRSLPFSADEFFAGIRECYNRRAEDPLFQNLTFCLLGVATPSDLIRDTRISPFNIGRRIELRDFTSEEAEPLALGLLPENSPRTSAPSESLYTRMAPRAVRLLKRILHWTNGHPYMTQRMCRAVAGRLENETTKPVDELEDMALVDAECERFFLSKAARETDDNLAFVRNRLLFSEANTAAVLELYKQVRLGRRVRDDETNPLCGILRLSGIVAVERGILQLRNRVYQQIFDKAWIETHMPNAELRRQKQAYRRGMLRAASIGAAVLVVVTVFAGAALKSANVARRAQVQANAQEKVANARSSHLYVETGTHLMEMGDNSAALAPLAEAMELDKDDGERTNLHRIRFAWALSHSPHIDRMWFADAPVRWAAYSPDKRWVAAACENGCAHIWNASTGIELPLNMKHDGAITDAAFSPDGTRFVTCGVDACARVWDLKALRLQFTLSGSAPERRSRQPHVSWSRDGQRIATCAMGSVIVWDVGGAPAGARKPNQDGSDAAGLFEERGIARRLLEDRTPGGMANRTAFTADGKGLTVIFDNVLAQTLRIPTGETSVLFALFGKGIPLHHAPPGSQARLNNGGCFVGRHLAISPDGRRLAIAGSFDKKGSTRGACVFDTQTGQAGERMPHDGIATYVAFSPDGRRIATASEDHTARVWDADGRAVTPPMRHAGSVLQIEFSPDGQRVITANADGSARVWDAANGRPVGSPLRHAGAVVMAQFGGDDSHVLTAGRDGTVRLWTLPPDEPDSVLFAESEDNFCRQLNDTRLFVDTFAHASIGGSDVNDRTDIWDLTAGAPLFLSASDFGHPRHDPVFCRGGSRCLIWRFNAFSPRQQEAQLRDVRSGKPISPVVRAAEVAVSAEGNRLFLHVQNEIWMADAVTGTRIKRLSDRAGGAASTMQITPDGRGLLISDAQNALQVVDVQSGAARTLRMPHDAPVMQAFFSPNGHYLFTRTNTEICRIWETTEGAQAFTPVYRSEKQEKDFFLKITFSPDSHYAILETAEGPVLVPLFESHSLRVRSLSGGGGPRPPIPFGFSPDSKRFFALSIGSQLYGVSSDTLGTPALNHSAKVTCLAFSPDGRRLLSGSEDGSARIWDALSAVPLTPPMLHDQTVSLAVLSADGRMAATGSEGGAVRVWDSTTGEALTPPLFIRDKGTTRRDVTQLEFTGNGRTIIASSYAGGRFWRLPQTSESLPHLQALAQLLSGQRYAARAGMEPLDASSLRAAWNRYRQK